MAAARAALRDELAALRALVVHQGAELPARRAAAAELPALRAAVARQDAELSVLRLVAAAQPCARRDAVAQAQADLRFNFISALICTAQNGFARDADPFVALCSETWGEEQLWDALKDLPHGPL